MAHAKVYRRLRTFVTDLIPQAIRPQLSEFCGVEVCGCREVGASIGQRGWRAARALVGDAPNFLDVSRVLVCRWCVLCVASRSIGTP